MNYQRIYDQFVEDRTAKQAALIASGKYYEKHHILPRSLGGGDEPENLIALKAGEHYFAHLCLAKIHGGSQWAALWMTSGVKNNRTNYGRVRLFRNRRMVSIARKEMGRAASESQKGISKPCTLTPEQLAARNKRVGDAQRGVPKPHRRGDKNPMVNPEVVAKVKAFYVGENLKRHTEKVTASRSTEESKAKTSAASKVMWGSKEYRKNITSKRKEMWANEDFRQEMCKVNKASANSHIRVAKRVLAATMKSTFADKSGYTGDIRKVKLDQAYQWLFDNGHLCPVGV